MADRTVESRAAEWKDLRVLGGPREDTGGQGAHRRSLMAFSVSDPASERKRGDQERESYNMRPCQTLL